VATERDERESTLTAFHTCHRRHIPITNYTVQIDSTWYVRSGERWAGPIHCFTQTPTSTRTTSVNLAVPPRTGATPNSRLQSISIHRRKHRPDRHRTPHQPHQHRHPQRRQRSTTNHASMTTNTPGRHILFLLRVRQPRGFLRVFVHHDIKPV
jgi:hypothetical protein